MRVLKKNERSILVIAQLSGREVVLRLKNIVAIKKQKGNAVMESRWERVLPLQKEILRIMRRYC